MRSKGSVLRSAALTALSLVLVLATAAALDMADVGVTEMMGRGRGQRVLGITIEPPMVVRISLAGRTLELDPGVVEQTAKRSTADALNLVRGLATRVRGGLSALWQRGESLARLITPGARRGGGLPDG